MNHTKKKKIGRIHNKTLGAKEKWDRKNDEATNGEKKLKKNV